MKKNEAFEHRFLKADDLNGKAKILTIDSVTQEELRNPQTGKTDLKTIVSWVEDERELILNSTNWDAVVKVTGSDDSDDWSGQRITLYPTETTMAGKTVPCIRVRTQPAKQQVANKRSKRAAVSKEEPAENSQESKLEPAVSC